MKILIIDQCSGSKQYPESSPVLTKTEVDSTARIKAIEEDGVAGVKARQLYAGRQQSFIDEATARLRNDDVEVDRYFISAGYGLVEESTRLPPYEVTFNDLSTSEIRERGSALGIQRDVLEVLDSNYDLVFLPLGKEYYEVLDLPAIYEHAGQEAPVVVFNREEDEETFENVVSVLARTAQAKEFGVIVVALKGKLIKNCADHLAEGSSIRTTDEIRDACLTDPAPQSDLGSF